MAITNSMRLAPTLLLAIVLLWQPSAAQPQGISPQQPTEEQRLAYVLGANDQIIIRVPGADEINDKMFLIDNQGNVVLPVIDSVKAGGLTIQQFEGELVKKLSAFYRSPQVRVT